MNNKEPEMEKNFWIALVLSMLIIMGYPVLTKWLSPQKQDLSKQVETTQIVKSEKIEKVETLTNATKESSGPFISKPLPPTVLRQENEIFKAEFSTLGGTISVLEYKGESDQHGNTKTVFYEGDPSTPGLFGIKLLNDKEELTQKIFKVNRRQEENSIEFVYEKPEQYRFIKNFTLDPKEAVIRLRIVLENLSSYERSFPLELTYGIQPDLSDPEHLRNTEVVAWTNGKLEAVNIDHVAKKGFSLIKDIVWTGLIKRYFAILIKSEEKLLAIEANSNREILWSSMKLEPISIQGGATIEKSFFIFAGPQRYETMKNFNLGFENVLSRGFFGPFKIWLLISLKFLNQYTHNYGWALILLTLLIKILFAPLTHVSFKSMKKMQALQPKIKAIQERYKKDPEKLNKETMGLFKRNRVNPMAGCLPMLIQMPILFAMFRLLPEAIELKGAPFLLWITDLSQPDRLFQFPFTIPFVGWNTLNILPILMTVSQFWYQKIMPQTTTSPEQNKIMAFMPIFFGFITYNMPSGLVLYWFVQNLLSIIQQVFINRIVIVLHHEDQG